MFYYILDSPDFRKSTGSEQITKSSNNNKNQEQKRFTNLLFPRTSLDVGGGKERVKRSNVKGVGRPDTRVTGTQGPEGGERTERGRLA